MKGSIDLYLKKSSNFKEILDCFDCIRRHWSIYDFRTGYFSCFYDDDFNWKSYTHLDENAAISELQKRIEREAVCAIMIYTKTPYERNGMTYTGGQLLFLNKLQISLIIDVNTLRINATKEVDFDFYFKGLYVCFMPILDHYDFVYE